MTKTPITVARGDGIGPEIMDATLKILEAAGAQIAPEFIEIGEKVYLAGNSAGIEPAAWESLRRTRVFLKAPITTPQGGGYKSLNVTVRKTLGLYANVRPCVAYAPFVRTKNPAMDVVIVRENEEDLYGGIEYRQTDEVYQCLKLISRPGCEKIVRYAFEYAKLHGRKKVTCFSKDNIMKLTDGLFHKIFNEIGKEYPDIVQDHLIIDIGSARLADRPEKFDVIVTLNLYGDIISDIAAEVSGSVGLGASVNVGERCAMFEAIHGSAPDIAGQGLANPSGLLLSSVLMLVHIGQPAIASKIQNAWLCAIEEGIHTKDIFTKDVSTRAASTNEFAQAVIERLGRKPSKLKSVSYAENAPKVMAHPPIKETRVAKKELAGVDVYVHARSGADDLAQKIKDAVGSKMVLQMITNRGVKVWPDGVPETFCSDHWRLRFFATSDKQPKAISQQQVIDLLQSLANAKIDCIKTENLYLFDGEIGYSLGQGE